MTTTHDEREEARTSSRAAFTGLAVALVWLAIVGGISYFLAGPTH